MHTELTGGCLCGAIRYALSAAPGPLVACYCTDCQRASGGGFSVNARLPDRAFRLLQGQPRIFEKTVDSGRRLQRHFCGDCGSPIFSRHADGDLVILKAGTLDERQAGLQVGLNIWARSRPDWAPIDAGLPTFEQGRPPPPPAAG